MCMKKLLFSFLLVGLVVHFTGCKKQKLEDQKQEAAVVEPSGYLSASKYENLVVEVQYVNGYKPTSSSIANMQSFLRTRLNKPGGITVHYKEIEGLNKSAYSAQDIRDLEEEQRTKYPEEPELAAYIVFLDKPYSENSGNNQTLGIAYAPTSMAIFEKTIQELSGGIGQPSTEKLETSVVNHEFGHVLGLVNNGTPLTSDHHDESHGAHCDNEECLMYWSVETSDFVSNLLGSSIPELDQACIDDLKANGGK